MSRVSDYIIYSVEAKNIDAVVKQFGPSTKLGAVVGGQTSCKAPEIAAFEAHLPPDVHIVSCHSLHGPKVDPKGQPLVLIKHRASDAAFAFVEHALSCLQSTHVYLTREQHDRITADTQAVTHAAFLSMGAAWRANNQFPWETARYIGGIENVKINITLRIYAAKWHVYAGLAILNPDAQKQIKQYAESVTDLFKLMLGGHRDELRERIIKAREAVFHTATPNKQEILLKEDLLNRFSLGEIPEQRLKNNHLSLLAMVDCWWKLGIVPYDHMICSTPVRPPPATFPNLADIGIALPHVARHNRVPLPQRHPPRGSHRHRHHRQHLPPRRPRIHLRGARLELPRHAGQLRRVP